MSDLAVPTYVFASLGDLSLVLDFGRLSSLFVAEALLGLLLLISLAVLQRRIRISRQKAGKLAEARQELETLSAQEAVWRQVAEHANDGLVYQDMEARILWANPAYCRIMGRTLEEIVGRRPQEFCFPPEVRPSDEEINSFVHDPDSYEFHNLVRRPNIRKNGERFWHEFNLSVVEPRPGEQRVILVSRDVTQQVRREQELERARADLHQAAHQDALTGLSNRIAFLKATDAILRHQRPHVGQIGLLYIDLDHFKAVNDSHGHAAGDRLLCHVADAIRASIGDGDLACRMGGDEFVIACPGVTDFDALQILADNLLERIREPIPWSDLMLNCGASIGVALSKDTDTNAEDLIRLADFALYEAKAPGAAHVARYDADLHARQEVENAKLEEFVSALDNDGIDFLYQPILDARTGRIRSVEALARWTRPNGEVVSPDRFLPYASRLNRLADVDFAAIRAVTSLVSELHGRGHRIRGAFNTSSDALAHPDFMDALDRVVYDAKLSPHWLVAEVLETTFFGPDTTNSAAAARINELREHGFSVYLDDFGVGYAGLAHLSQLNVSGVKLDRSLIANVNNDRSVRIITSSILRLCDELGVGTLAEGVEDAAQADFLVEHGCFRLQGFGIARPMARSDVISMIEADAQIEIAPRQKSVDHAPPISLVASA
ncbi:EAL domain-containing protein [Gymnodinialimonas sp. 2305UL16-5]|uniref:putative bifunctional diguanylate cyclase/phosphodiesterase n=1 Tax=Gymnodinialimonas mytili TaxID=3126503 RepID=UPI0030A8D1B2